MRPNTEQVPNKVIHCRKYLNLGKIILKFETKYKTYEIVLQ